MTRFNILLEDAVKLVYLAIQKGIGGEILYQKHHLLKLQIWLKLFLQNVN